MSVNIGNNDKPLYDVQVPELSSYADVQEAFRTYHYGTPIPNPDTSLPSYKKSIAGILSTLQSGKVNNIPFELVSGENLDLKTSPGYYAQNSYDDANSTGSTGYPPYPLSGGTAYPGLLLVVADGGIIYQTYQMSGGQNALYWRYRPAGSSTFVPWKQVTDATHVHDDRYYLKEDVYTRTQANTLLATKPDSNANNLFVVPAKSTDPTVPDITITPSDGDLWFW